MAAEVAVAGNKSYQFEAKLQKHPKLNATFIEFPYNVEAEFGVKGQVKVVADIDGVIYQGSLAKMGHHCHRLGVTQAIRKQLGKESGDVVNVVIKQDTATRKVTVPHEIQSLLDQDQSVKAFFDGLSFTNRKEYVNWITTAKKEITKQNRLSKMFDLLKSGAKHP